MDGKPPSSFVGTLDPDLWVQTHRTTYNRMAADYTRWIDDYAASDEAERFVRMAATSRVHEPYILDAGCGPGRDACLLKLAGAQVMGLELSEAMLREAHTLACEQLCQGDIRQLPIGSDTFDAIWCFAALGHLPPAAVPSVLDEFRRVVGAGWLYVVVREGAGVRHTAWEAIPPRYFTDFTLANITDHLRNACFTIKESGMWPAPDSRRWLHLIARGT
jgi:SAM-dependent methyltransferase